MSKQDRTAMKGAILGLALLAVAAPAATQESPVAADPGPPTVTTERLGAVFGAFGPRDFVGSVTVVTRSVISKMNGDRTEEELDVQRVTSRPDGTTESIVVQAVRNGKDITAERRREHEAALKKLAERRAAGDSSGAGTRKGTGDLGMRLPTGEDLPLYSFSPPVTEGGVQVSSFEPRPGQRDDGGHEDAPLVRGRLAWSPETLDPVWIELALVDPPPVVAEMRMRFEFDRIGTSLGVRRSVTDGVVKLLLFRRRLHAVAEVTVEAPEPPGPAAPPVGP